MVGEIIKGQEEKDNKTVIKTRLENIPSFVGLRFETYLMAGDKITSINNPECEEVLTESGFAPRLNKHEGMASQIP